jgi:L-rhamnose isomerase/sugar isomerase
LLAQVREEMGAPTDPVAAYRASGHDQKLASERGAASGAGSGYPT